MRGREGEKTEEGEESIKLHTARWKGRGALVRERWKERGKKGLEDRHRDEEQDALRDASSQKGRSRVCTARARGARYVLAPREKPPGRGGKKNEDSALGFYELSFSPFDPCTSVLCTK